MLLLYKPFNSPDSLDSLDSPDSQDSMNSYSVLIIDMAHYQEADGERTISGFATKEEAIAYARRRVLNSLAELRKPNQTKEELRQLWALYGEDALVIGMGYAASDELDTLLNP